MNEAQKEMLFDIIRIHNRIADHKTAVEELSQKMSSIWNELVDLSVKDNVEIDYDLLPPGRVIFRIDNKIYEIIIDVLSYQFPAIFEIGDDTEFFTIREEES